MHHCRKAILLGVLSLLVAIPAQAIAESIWLEPNRGDEVRLESVLPNFKNADFSTLSMLWFLSGTFEVKPNLHLSADLPLARFADSHSSESSTSIGDPYLGLDI